MIHSFEQIAAILNYLKEKQQEYGNTFKFRLVKHLNHATSIYLYYGDSTFRLRPDNINDIKVPMPDESNRISINDTNVFPPVDIREVTDTDYHDDRVYYDAFFSENSSFEGVTRRLENAFGKYPHVSDPQLPPVVSFYSYKGGVGRTTTLTAAASYHARRTGAKVLILDCDFEAPGLVNFFGMNEDDLASKGGIVEYLTDVAYLQDKSSLDISKYIHVVSTGASRDPLGYAGEKGIIYIMNAGNISVGSVSPDMDTPADLRTHQDHYLHGLARLDFSNSEHIVSQFQEMLLNANRLYKPDVILIDSRTGFNDVFNNLVLRLSGMVLGFFGTSRQNIPGLYNFLDTVSVENNDKRHPFEVILVNSIASNVRQSYKAFKRQVEIYNENTENEVNPEVFSIEYVPRMSEIGTPTDDGDILLDYSDPGRYAFPDYQNGMGERLLEYLSRWIEKKKLTPDTINVQKDLNPYFVYKDVSAIKDIILPVQKFFEEQNRVNHAENLDSSGMEAFLGKHYYFKNYLRDLFLRDMFLVRGYKGTGKTLLYRALQNPSFVEKLIKINNIGEDFRFVSVIDPSNILHLSSLDFKPGIADLDAQTYYRRFWTIYIWNALMDRFPGLHKSEKPVFQVMSNETTRVEFERLMSPAQILDIEHDLRKLNEKLVEKSIKVVISFDYLDKVVETSEWNTNGHPIAQLIKFGQTNPYSNIFPKIFLRTDLYHKIQNINNKNSLESKVLSLDWSTDEMFAYFFKIVHSETKGAFIDWLNIKTPDKYAYHESVRKTLNNNDSQIPLEQKDILEYLVDNFFGEYVYEKRPNYGRSYEWFHLNLKNANDVISLRPFIALLAIGFNLRVKEDVSSTSDVILPGRYFNNWVAREKAAEAYLTDIWSEYKDPVLKTFLETVHKSDNPKLNRYRQHSILEADMRLLIKAVFELNKWEAPQWDKVQEIIEMLKDAGIIKQNTAKNVSYSFAFLYKYYLRLGGNPQSRGRVAGR